MQSPHTKAISPTGCRTRELLAVQQQCYPPTSLIVPIESILLTPLGIYACYKCTLNSNPLLPVYQQLNLQSGESSTRQTDMKYSQWKNRQLFRAAPAVRGKLCTRSAPAAGAGKAGWQTRCLRQSEGVRTWVKPIKAAERNSTGSWTTASPPRVTISFPPEGNNLQDGAIEGTIRRCSPDLCCRAAVLDLIS